MGRSGPAEAGRSGPEAGAAQRGSAVQLAIREPRTPPPFSYQQYRRLWVLLKVSQRHLHQKFKIEPSKNYSALANSPTPSFTRRVSARILCVCQEHKSHRDGRQRDGKR